MKQVSSLFPPPSPQEGLKSQLRTEGDFLSCHPFSPIFDQRSLPLQQKTFFYVPFSNCRRQHTLFPHSLPDISGSCVDPQSRVFFFFLLCFILASSFRVIVGDACFHQVYKYISLFLLSFFSLFLFETWL